MSSAMVAVPRDLIELRRVHRMAVPVVRQRVALVAATLLVIAWALVSMIGNPAGVYSMEELRHLGGIPFAPPQIQQRLAPGLGGQDFDQLISQLEDIYRGGSQPGAPTPGATR